MFLLQLLATLNEKIIELQNWIVTNLTFPDFQDIYGRNKAASVLLEPIIEMSLLALNQIGRHLYFYKFLINLGSLIEENSYLMSSLASRDKTISKGIISFVTNHS